MRLKIAVLACGLTALALCSPARATFHTWRISEVFSNPSGTVQFIEFEQPVFVFDDERFLSGHGISSGANNFTFPSNLPGAPTGTSRFLVATPGYAALAGVPAPDYTTPTNNFFNTAGDTLNFSGIDSLTFTAAQLGASNTQSLVRTSYGGSTYAIQTASPRNFAGVTGTVPEPGFLLGICGAAMCLLRRRGAFISR